MTSQLHKRCTGDRKLQRLEKLIAWTRMAFKPKKSRSLSLWKGKVKHPQLMCGGGGGGGGVGGPIPMVADQPVQGLGMWYVVPLTDRHKAVNVQRQVEEELGAIDYWGFRPPKTAKSLVCPVWALAATLVTAGIAMANGWYHGEDGQQSFQEGAWSPQDHHKWSLYSSTSKLTKLTTSFVEEFKVVKARMYTMIRYSKDPAIMAAQARLILGGNGSRQKLSRRHRSVAPDERGCCSSAPGPQWPRLPWWSRGSGGDRRLVVKE